MLRASGEGGQKQEDLKVGYQGEPGAYGEIAAAGHGGIPQGFASFEKLLEALHDGLIDEAVRHHYERAGKGEVYESLRGTPLLYGMHWVRRKRPFPAPP